MIDYKGIVIIFLTIGAFFLMLALIPSMLLVFFDIELYFLIFILISICLLFGFLSIIFAVIGIYKDLVNGRLG